MRFKGNVLLYGAAIAAGVIVFSLVVPTVRNCWLLGLILVLWNVLWYAVFYRQGQRRKSAPPSRF
jgi:hypothetical protein